MGPTPEQSDAFKQQVKNLHELTNNQQAVDWSQIAQVVSQLIALLLASHVK